MKLKKSFYLNTNVLEIAEQLIGKELHIRMQGVHKAGIIVETEAYSFREKACHAYLKRYTNRTKTMFMEGGVAYVYLCYGIHHLFNVVTNSKNIPEAVLIRAIQPLEEHAIKRITAGPGKLTKYLGITKALDATSLVGDKLWIEDRNREYPVATSIRIGIDYAEEDANLPWRFTVKDNPWVSK